MSDDILNTEEESNIPQYMTVLNEEQLEAVIHFKNPLLILAGAGSGKTRVITTKIAYLIREKKIRPWNILAVTFTNKAAREMKERAILLEEESVHSEIKTFHSFGVWFLRRYATEIGYERNFTIYDDNDAVSLLTKAVPGLLTSQAKEIYHKISLAKDYCLNPSDVGLSRIDPSPEFADFYERYEERLREVGNFDFGDLILKPLTILRDREDIRSEFHSRFKVILVDEFQDTNVAQYRLLKMMTGPETYLCVVGDDDQSIYKFRGAEINNILSFQDKFENTDIIRLQKNYRSINPILKVADDIISHNKERLGKTLQAVRKGDKKPVLLFLPTQEEESLICAKMIKDEFKKGVPYSDWAIMYRTNAQSLNFETKFLDKNIPYKIVGSLKFYDREEIKDLLAFLALMTNPKDEVAFSRIVNKPARGIGEKTQKQILEFYREEKITLLEACRRIITTLPKRAKAGVCDFLNIFVELHKIFTDDSSDIMKSAFPQDELVASALDSESPKENTIEDLSFDFGSFLQESATDAQTKEDSLHEKNDKDVALVSTKKKPTEQKEEKVDETFKPTRHFENKQQLSGLALFVDAIAELSGLREFHKSQDEAAGTQRIANIEELINAAAVYNLSQEGLYLFLEQIELDRTAIESTGEDLSDAVTLITLHNAKGLEFPRVVLTGLEQGIFPRDSIPAGGIEEERRLMYVGVTRAKDELYMTSCATRRLYGKTSYMEPSPFLLEINPANIKILGEQPRIFTAKRAGDFSANSKNASPLARRWAKGVKIYHDDYGYGEIIHTEETDSEYQILVQFESGEKKRFFPKYNANKLEIIQDQ